MDAATQAAEEAKTAVQAIDAKLDEWEKGCEPVLRHHHNEHLEAFSLSKNGDNYRLAFCFWCGNNPMVSCDYRGTDLAEAMKKVFNRWG